MRLWVPYHPEIVETFGRAEWLRLYEGVDGLPEIAGGRFRITAPNVIPLDRVGEVAERHGPRFSLLATSTAPELTPRAVELFELLERNRCGLTVASLELAVQVKDRLPDLELRASCIMSLFTPFRAILDSPLFRSVAGPQYWNYDLDRMRDAVPQEQRRRVSYIVNSACRWDGDPEACNSRICRSHYAEVTRHHREGLELGPDWRKHLSSWPEGCPSLTRTCTVQDGIANVLKLRARGFSSFKLQGRSVPGQPDPWVTDVLAGLQNLWLIA
jgi:hypothetical protein